MDFVQTRFVEFEPITPKNVVRIEGCPVEDEETASKYLNLMMKERLHLKRIYTYGKVYFTGCSTEEDTAFKRVGFEGWAGAKTTEFLQRHPRVGRRAPERIYRLLEYREPLVPVFPKFFPGRAAFSLSKLAAAKNKVAHSKKKKAGRCVLH